MRVKIQLERLCMYIEKALPGTENLLAAKACWLAMTVRVTTSGNVLDGR